MNKMKHGSPLKLKIAFSRLKNDKGSVLFYIIAVMSVLIVLASAVYYSVVSSEQQIVQRYGDEQAYQSALSLNDIVTEYISKNTESSIVNSVIALSPGGSITTKGDGTGEFAQIAGGLGDYKVTISKVRQDGDIHVVQIETEVDVNGEKEKVVSVGEFMLTTTPYTFDRFFTSTGYAPNDVIMTGMTITSTVYLDNEYTRIGATTTGNSGMDILAEIIAAGTLEINNTPINSTGTASFDITAGNNLILTYSGGQGQLNLNGGTIRVGGNLIQGSSFNLKNNTDVYVVGDYISGRPSDDSTCEIYINGDAAFFNNEVYYGKVYVNGDVFLDKSINSGNKFPGGIVVGGNIYINQASGNDTLQKNYFSTEYQNNKVKYYTDNTISFITAHNDSNSSYEVLRLNMNKARELAGGVAQNNYVWPSDSMACESIQEVKYEINKKIGKSEYINWDLEKKFHVDSDTSMALLPSTDFDFAAGEFVKTVSAESGTVYVIGDITTDTTKTRALIFDTYAGTDSNGNATYEDIYVYLKPNCKATVITESWGGKTTTFEDAGADNDTFLWGFDKTRPGDSTSRPFHTLVKGKGSVIFVLPDGTKYINRVQSYVGHISVFEHINGCTVAAGTEPPYQASFQANKVTDIIDPDTNRFTDEVLAQTAANGQYIHNNIFLVTVDKNVSMEFEVMQTFFAGFVYAPYMTFTASGGGGQGGMLGGIIVSDYTMPQTSNTYVCTVPYDYYFRFVPEGSSEEERKKYMEKLMADAGCTTSLGAANARTWRKYGYN